MNNDFKLFKKVIHFYQPVILSALVLSCASRQTDKVSNPEAEAQKPGNPIAEGWYADPEGVIFGNEFWIFPTYSAEFTEQLFFDAFSSTDLVNWKKHTRILDTTKIKWARQAMWAPAAVKKDDRYYLFFSANDVQRPGRPTWDPDNDINHFGGIGVAVAGSPGGPYEDHLGKPLISEFHNDAQPIDQFVFQDTDGAYYMFYGGWGHCNLGKLNEDFTGFIKWEDGSLFKEITPENYVEGPFMFRRNNKYYLMWSEGDWTNDTYKVAYSISDKVTGPFKRIGTILQSDKNVATGAGHNSVINIPGTDEWYMVYHRRPIPNQSPHHRVTCIDKMNFNDDGTIQDIKMTSEGVEARVIAGDK